MTFDQLPQSVTLEACRAVEDAIFANGASALGEPWVTSDTSRLVLDRLLELGWTPPAVTS